MKWDIDDEMTSLLFKKISFENIILNNNLLEDIGFIMLSKCLKKYNIKKIYV